MYAFTIELALPFDRAIDAVMQALQEEKMGVVSDVNVQGIVKAKLGEEMMPYRILGACVTPLAKRVIEADPDAGVLLPCNIVVRGLQENRTSVVFMDPQPVLGLANSTLITAVASEAKKQLEKVRDRLSQGA